MFCPNCGATTEGKYCEKCGAQVGGGTTTGTAPPTTRAPGLPLNLAGALCYIFPVICPLIFLILEPYKREKSVRFAAFQSLFLTFSLILINEVAGLFFIGSLNVGLTFYQILRLAEFVLILYLAFKAYQNEPVVLPGIGPLAQKQA